SLGLTTGAAEALLLYAWPFNVRELEQALSAAAVRAHSERRLRSEHLPPPIAAMRGPRAVATHSTLPPLAVVAPPGQVPDTEPLRIVFERLDFNVSRVAAHFGRDRRQIYRWLAQAGIDIASLRASGDDD